MLRGLFDQEHGFPEPGIEDVYARSGIAHAELVRTLRREEDRQEGRDNQQVWNFAFARGYIDGRQVATAAAVPDRVIKASQVAPPRSGYVCPLCRAQVAQELSGFDLSQEEVVRALGDEAQLDRLARELGADIPGHRCEARDGLGTCACGCAIWREPRPRSQLLSLEGSL